MGRFNVKIEDKTPSDANNRGKGFGGGNNVWREAFAGTSKAMNALQVKFDCREGNEGGQFLECVRLTTMYLSTKLEGGGDVKTSIQNGKVFEPPWQDPVRPKPAATKAMLQEEYGTRSKRVEKLQINLSTAYGLVLGQCTDYLQSHLEGQERWEQMPNDRDLLELIRSIKSLFHKYDGNTEYQHVVYHTLLCCFMLFRQGDYSNLEYKQRFKEQIEVLEAYNGGVLFGNSPGVTVREIATL